MVSQLGVSSDEIPFKVRLQLGKSSETRTVVVRNILAEPGQPKTGADQRPVSP
jgi:hypothetical protein